VTAAIPLTAPALVALRVEGMWSPLAVVLIVVAVAQLLEDVAVLAAAALAVAGVLSWPVAVLAAWAGILVGDLWLYGAGRAGSRLLDRVGADRVAGARRRLAANDVAALATARVVPFLRLPVFLAAGALGLPFRRFALLCALLALPWILALMGFGLFAEAVLPGGAWTAVLIVALLAFVPRIVRLVRESLP
jgi:membrane protein DedA with SNARE-associated domain